MIRSLALIVALPLTLAGCDDFMKSRSVDPAAAKKQAALDRDAAFEGEIMIGRVEVMQDQTRRSLEVLGLNPPAAEAAPEREPFRRLQDTVGRYNDLRQFACQARAADGEVCRAAPYQPQWANVARPPASGTGLRQMAENMQDQMTPLWTSVCSKAQARSGDAHLCAIE